MGMSSDQLRRSFPLRYSALFLEILRQSGARARAATSLSLSHHPRCLQLCASYCNKTSRGVRGGLPVQRNVPSGLSFQLDSLSVRIFIDIDSLSLSVMMVYTCFAMVADSEHKIKILKARTKNAAVNAIIVIDLVTLVGSPVETVTYLLNMLASFI